MKKIMFLLLVFLGFGFFSCTSSYNVTGSPYSGKTVHKPLKKAISRREANRVAFHGWNPYTRKGNKVYKSSTVSSTFKRPNHSTKYKYNTKKR